MQEIGAGGVLGGVGCGDEERVYAVGGGVVEWTWWGPAVEGCVGSAGGEGSGERGGEFGGKDCGG